MKKLCAVILVVTMLVSVLAGCQKTPETLVALGKDTEQLMDTSKGNAEGKTLAQMLDAPSKMELSVTSGKGDVTVNAAADVVIPNVDSIPVVRVKERAFSQEEADKLLAYFIGDKAFNNRYASSLDADVQSLMGFKDALSKETDPVKRAALQEAIDELESAGITDEATPEEVKPAAKVFTSNPQGGDSISGYSSDKEGKYYFQIQNNPEGRLYKAFFSKEQMGYSIDDGYYYHEEEREYVYKLGVDNAVLQTELLISKEAAQQKAEDVLAALGFDEMSLSDCTEVWGGTTLDGRIDVTQGHHAYNLEYVRSIGDVPITRMYNGIEENTAVASDEESGDGVKTLLWPYERVYFIIDDSGIIEFSWVSPYEVQETIAESAKVKPFVEIAHIFSKMSLAVYAHWGEQTGGKVTFDISKAQLGLMRITEKNNTDTSLIVPVWDFFGADTLNANGETNVTKNDMRSYLTINAIDGSIIERSYGY